jgi:acyl carrier protein
MNFDDTVEQICQLLAPYNAKGIALSADTDIPAELNIDSVDVMDFVMEVEDLFDVEIPLNVVSETRTIGDMARVVIARVNKAAK